MDRNAITEVLEWAYDKAVFSGIPGTDSSVELAEEYLKQDGTLFERVNSLIRWEVAKSATSGFMTGLGGAITLPITSPANLASVLYIQLKLIAAIAHMGGHDVREDKVKTLAFVCLCGSAVTEVLKEVGIKVGMKLTEQAILKISAKVIAKINTAVGFKLLTKFGQTGVVQLGKAVPLIGGGIGALFDGVSTNIIGNVARDTFISIPD
ncbi:EcsC family protein [Paenibacillus wynnii]|uniref:EcsC family protein n=1 Tax=Paenibacillus wynnii TaxID=268407 RepID=UPI00278E69DD|nr:EcsC family protein [Paenibacillus wynnii]MDQ0193834.1 hypothetical protein [Paenibacillus wynnii]